MPSVKKSLLVPYSAEMMFRLVDAVEDYPLFLPWCGETEILARDHSATTARIEIRYLGVTRSFTTTNRKEGFETMHIELVDGPFKSLEGLWHFCRCRRQDARSNSALNTRSPTKSWKESWARFLTISRARSLSGLSFAQKHFPRPLRHDIGQDLGPGRLRNAGIAGGYRP